MIALVREGTRRGIYVVSPSGSDVVRLPHGTDYRPGWSPDGTRIVFQRFVRGGHSDIFVMAADGSNVRRLTRRGGFQPDWSPRGTAIVFGSSETVTTTSSS
jgi:TolB protein